MAEPQQKRNSAVLDLAEFNKDLARLKGEPSGGVQKSRSGIFGFNNARKREEKNLEDRIKSEIFANNVLKGRNEFVNNLRSGNHTGNSGKNVHKRQESDSRISLNFVRGFRRENTDFFPLSKRHSAVLEQSPSATSVAVPQVPLRSSAIFRRHNKGEPILTDFVKTRDLENMPTQSQTPPSVPRQQSSSRSNGNLDFLRPRREKTESVIVLKNRQQLPTTSPLPLLQNHQVNTKHKPSTHTHIQKNIICILIHLHRVTYYICIKS